MSENIVLPGEFLDERKGRKIGKNVYFEGEKLFSKILGMPRINEDEVFVIPMCGVYMPSFRDKVVGVVTSTEISGWLVDINSPYPAFMPLAEAVDEFVDTSRTDISRYFDTGDVIFGKISRVTKTKSSIQVSLRDIGSRKLYGGIIIKVNPCKIPRIIGKAGSMVTLIKEKTKCEIYTGQNGVVWIKGEDKAKAIEAILKIEKESHTTGLTEKIEKMLSD
jgi:exosome complex component RRP4